jgi:hypothetical protein
MARTRLGQPLTEALDLNSVDEGKRWGKVKGLRRSVAKFGANFNRTKMTLAIVIATREASCGSTAKTEY